jgi:hypothetical protein
MTYPDRNSRNVNMHIMLLEMATDMVEEVRRTILQELPELPAAGPSGLPTTSSFATISLLQLPLAGSCKMLTGVLTSAESGGCDF